MTRLLINGWSLGMGAVGQGAYAVRLLEGLARHGGGVRERTTVLLPAAILEEWRARLAPLGVEALRTARWGHPLLDALAWNRRLLADPRLRERDTLFFSPGGCWGGPPPPRMAITHHDCIYRHFPVYLGRRGLRRWATFRAERYLRHARIVFTESDHARADIAAHTGVPLERIRSIPAWLPPEFFPASAREGLPAVRQRYHLPDRYWLYLGGYDVRKNVGTLLRAYAMARRAAPCPPLVLAGRIPTRRAPTLCDVAGARRETGLGTDALCEPGFIADADLPALYAGAELFVYPSLMEGYGLPPMEAMGCGCPAWAADNSSLREVVRDADYRFDARDVGSLAERLAAAARRPPPMNPSFRREDHDERTAITAYLDTLHGMCAP